MARRMRRQGVMPVTTLPKSDQGRLERESQFCDMSGDGGEKEGRTARQGR